MPTRAAFLRAAIATPTDECILWPFASTTAGYGSLLFEGRIVGSHVVACEMAHGPAPAGMEASHSCHVSACFNPRHLRWKTHAANLAERVDVGTLPMGERCYQARLTADDVREIRSVYAAGGTSLRLLGLDYGVSKRTIHAVVTGENWRHVAAVS